MNDKTQAEAESQGNDEFEKEFQRLGEQDRTGGQPDDNADPDPEPERQGDEPPADSAADADKPTAETPPKDDPWASAPPELRKLYENERTSREKAEGVVKAHEGRLRAFQTEITELRSKTSEAPPAEKPKTKEEIEAREERLKKLREEFPEVAGPLLEEIEELRRQNQTLSKGVETVQSREVETELDAQEKLLAGRHGDWLEQARSEAFGKWVLEQPRYVREAIHRNGSAIVDGEEVADILDRFKATLPKDEKEEQRRKVDERRQEQLDAARGPENRLQGQPEGFADDFEAEWKRLSAREKVAARR